MTRTGTTMVPRRGRAHWFDATEVFVGDVLASAGICFGRLQVTIGKETSLIEVSETETGWAATKAHWLHVMGLEDQPVIAITPEGYEATICLTSF